MPTLPSYVEVTKQLQEKNRLVHLLLGNGFSMSYDSGIFSYNALGKFVDTIDDEILHQLFSVVKTNNFELLMKQLDDFAGIAKIFKVDAGTIKQIENASLKLKSSLIDAIKELHPEHVFTIPEEKSAACASFLGHFLLNEGKIFTANYDLLLYWVLMRNEIEKSIDGFGRDAEETDEYVPPEDVEYSELRWGKYRESQNVFYLHGALPLFDSGAEIIKEEYTSQHYLLENIKERLDRNEYPIFITAGNGAEKLKNIMHNRYLAYCYESLSALTGSLITFGFNFGEYDDHLIAAINKASKFSKNRAGKLFSIYIGVYSDADLKHIQSIQKKFKCKVNLFDAKTVNPWGS